jgi:putative SOS response-associated peptidase YedK
MSKKAQELAARYGKKSDILEIVKEIIEEQQHVNGFNFPDYPVVTPNDEIQVFKWGLIPHWTKSADEATKIKAMTLNAKSETIFEKPSFRQSIFSRRCLIPSTGFFEWRHDVNKKTPYFIRLKEDEIFSMAGIYDEWADPQTGEISKTFSILTTSANPMMEYIHNSKKRMLVILPKNSENAWLFPNLKQKEITKLLVPFDEKKMESCEVEYFIRKNPKDTGIIHPKEILHQGELF